MAVETYFTWPDYLVFSLSLVLSAAIGFYYACTGGKQKTTKEYLLADRNMHWFPVACSLLASFTSTQTLIGLPGEIYTFGTIYLIGYIFKVVGVILGTTLFLPVFMNLNMISVYKYIEMRFGLVMKLMMLVSSIFGWLLYTTLVIYGPALSVSAVTGINIWLAVMSVALVGLFYTVMGGLKAVLWTDTLQFIIMVAGTVTVLVYGSVKEGGFGEVLRVNYLSGRMDITDSSKVLDLDPRARHTLWSTAVQGILLYMNVYGTGAASIQRALTLRSKKDIAVAYGATAIGTGLFGLICGFIGLVIFSYNRYCDPVTDGTIFSKDQLYPLYIMQLLGHLPGLPGLILSSIFSASLSTISSVLNSGAAILLEDCVRPLKPNLSEFRATLISKIISLVLGGIALLLVLFAKNFGTSLLSMGMTFVGILNGPGLAVFTMGIFLPVINNKGAIVGYLVGSAFAAWEGFGNLVNKPYVYSYPVTTAGCNITDDNLLANISSPVYDPSTWNPQSHYRSGIAALYDVSYLWIFLNGATVTVIVSVIFSFIFASKDDKPISRKLLSPLLYKNCCFLTTRVKNTMEFADTAEESTDGSKSTGSSNSRPDKEQAYDNDIQIDENFELENKVATKL